MASAMEEKLALLLEHEGYQDIADLAEAIFSDSVGPAICMNGGCNFVCEMEPDQDSGWCDECNTNSMKSALVLAGLI
jgi:hypothetical protein